MQRQHSSQATSTLGNTPNLNIGFLHQKENPTDVCSNRWAEHEMGGTDFKWGCRAPLPPPLALTLGLTFKFDDVATFPVA